jgi:hypothetical protein
MSFKTNKIEREGLSIGEEKGGSMSSQRKIAEMMAVIDSWFEMVQQSIIEGGGNPDDGEWFDFDCELCGGPCIIIVHSGNSFSLSPGGECCRSLVEKKKEEIGLKVEAAASAFIYFDSQKRREGPKAFVSRMKQKQSEMS